MKTTLKGTGTEVHIDTEGPVVIIGESINPTRRKKLVETLSMNDFSFAVTLGKSQLEAGAEVLDVNVGYPGVDDVSLLPATVKALQAEIDAPLCLDTPNPKALEAALGVYEGKALINSVNGEEKSMASVLPLVKDHGAAVIGLLMDDEGITHDPQKRLAIAEKILNRAVKQGIAVEDVVIDPLAMAVSADPDACLITLETIRLVREKLEVNITQGSSNISFGLPGRGHLNNAHMAISIWNGLTCPITNPLKATSFIRAMDLIRKRDDFAMRFIEQIQKTEA